MLVGLSVISSTDGEARVIQGIITGIGFIGGGAIFKGKNHVTGMASAASLWNTGAIGIAVAFNRFEIAIALSLLNVVTLYLVGRLQKSVEKLNDNEVKDE
jgi:putative Mg2+ transporter-C (MgtC) family protein